MFDSFIDYRAVFVAFALAAAPSQPPRDVVGVSHGLIAGRVLAADTGTPLRRVRLMLSGSALSGQRVVSSDGEGRYRFEDIPPGRYSLVASRNGYLRLSFGQRRPNGLGRPLQLSQGQRLQNVDFALPRMSVLSGVVTDEKGEPLEGCSVTALQSRMTSNGRQFSPVAVAVTDASGFFRLLSLMPGDYWLRATNSETWSTNDRDSSDIQSYSPTYFPGSVVPDGARPIRVPLGGEVTGVDFALVPGRPVAISGTALNSRGEPLSGRSVQLVEQTFTGSGVNRGGLIRSTKSAPVDTEGGFKFTGVASGSYRLEVNLPPEMGHRAESASIPIVISDGTVTTILITTSPGADVSGTIETEGANLPKFSLNSLRVVARTSSAGTPPLAMETDNGQVQDNGSFTVHGILGQIELTIPRLPEGWFVTHVYVGQQDVTDTFLDPREISSPVRIVVSDRVARVSGTVSGGQPNNQDDFTVLIFPTDESKWGVESRLVRAVRTDQSHQFSIANIPAAEYYAVALPDIDQDQWLDMLFLQEAKSHADRIRVNDTEKKIISLKAVVDAR